MPIHQLTVGDLTCTVLNDTTTPYAYDPATTDMVGAPWDEIRAALDDLGWPLPVNLLGEDRDVPSRRWDPLHLGVLLRADASEAGARRRVGASGMS